MPRGNPSPKLAITIDPEVHAGLLAAAAEDGMSVSAWITDATRRALIIRNGLRAVAEYEAEYGAFTEAEMTAARERVEAQLADPARKPRR